MKTVKSHNLSHNLPVLHSFNTQLHYSYTLMFRSHALQDNGMSEWGSQVQIINQVKSFLDGKLNKLDFDEKQITVRSVHGDPVLGKPAESRTKISVSKLRTFLPNGRTFDSSGLPRWRFISWNKRARCQAAARGWAAARLSGAHLGDTSIYNIFCDSPDFSGFQCLL